MMAVAYRYQKNYDNALRATQKIVDIDPRHARVRQERGYIFLAKGQDEHALVNFSEAVRINPALMFSWQNIQKLYDSKNLTKNQQRELNKANAQVEYLKQLPQALLAVHEFIYDDHLQKAENLCRDFLLNNKHNIEGMRMLAEIGMKLKIYDDAEFLLESCVELSPENIMARAQYLSLLITLGQYRKAEIQVKYLIDKQPDNFRFLVAQGSVLVGLGQLEQGISLLKG
ncbi:MAG: tetratricopeptide repeat protein [Enterobacterales bacterium]|nr:tetratricopeptide repeat protein [Enterobacterales bacterium]